MYFRSKRNCLRSIWENRRHGGVRKTVEQGARARIAVAAESQSQIWGDMVQNLTRTSGFLSVLRIQPV
jgi:hypothetical protein